MEQLPQLKVVARIHNDFMTKFAIPRQSGLVEEISSVIVFEPQYRNSDAVRGLEQFSHIWLIWQFSEAIREQWSPTVRPPRLGGNTRMGVFATRSPYRPNALGLSCVRLVCIEKGALIVDGADLMDNTPIYDIKPYLSFTDCRPDASDGFANEVFKNNLTVKADEKLLKILPFDKQKTLIKILEQNPIPAYHNDKNRIYGFKFWDTEVKFSVQDNILTLLDIKKIT